MLKIKNLPLTISLVIVISLVIGWGIDMVLAWTNPSAPPPGGNVSAPINVSSGSQYKTGIVGFSTSGVDSNYGLTVGNNATYGIKSDRYSWFGANVDVVGTLTANSLVGTISARNVSSGQFGANTGGGNYYFPARVGIGTTSPDARLMVDDAGTTASYLLHIQADDVNPWAFAVGNDSYSTTGFFRSYLSSAGDFIMRGANSSGNDLVIDAGGNVGIGDTAPTAKFELSGGAASISETLYVENIGNVGIGTSGPGYKLDVQGGQINASGGLCIAGVCQTSWAGVGGTSGWTDDGTVVRLTEVSDSVGIGTTHIGATLEVAGTASISEVLYIQNQGNVGIGTTSPGYKLDVSGDARVTGILYAGSISGGYTGTISAPNVSSGQFGANTGGGNYSFPASVGIGTTNIGATLEVAGTASISEVLYIQDQGNVGIGTTGPNYKLDVSGNARITGYNIVPGGIYGNVGGGAADVPIWAVGETYNNWGIFYNEGSPDRIEFKSGGSVNSAIALDSGDSYFNVLGGNVGIGTTHVGATLEVAGTASISEVLYIQDQGNVGIGTTSPGYKLDVSGDARVTGILYAGSISGGYTGTISAPNVSSGQFGANTGGGNYSFPASVGIGTTNIGATLEVAGTASISEVLYIQDQGNVGIGTASPRGILDVDSLTAGAAIYFSTDPNYNIKIIGGDTINAVKDDGTGRALYLNFGNLANVNLVAGVNQGNVGIGTSGPGQKLTVAGGWIEPAAGYGLNWSNNAWGGSGDDAWIQYYREGTSGENTKLEIGINNDADDDLSFYQAGAERMTISGGNVYINNDLYVGAAGKWVSTIAATSSPTRVERYTAICAAAVGTGYGQVAAVTPGGIGTVKTGDEVCDQYVGNNSVTNWSCKTVPYVYGDYRNGNWLGTDVRQYWSSCGTKHGPAAGGGDGYEWYNPDTGSGPMLACCVKDGESIFYDRDDTGYYSNPNSTSRMNAINYNDLNYAGSTAYGFKGANVYADTVNSGVDSDPLELVYVYGTGVRVGTGSGNKWIAASQFIDGNDTSYYADPAGTSVLNTLRVGLITNDDGSVAGWGNTINFSGGDDWAGWDSDNSDPLYMGRYNTGNNTTDLRIIIGDDTGSSGDRLTIGTTGNNVLFSFNAAGKLTVPTIDPQYEIDGKKYATYVSDFAGGVRVETSGVAEVSPVQSSKFKVQSYQYVIDFDNLEKGSDLWLFWKTSNKNMDDLVVLLSPAFKGKVWYNKEGNKLIIYGDASGEVSFRLTLPRLDDEKWGNAVED